MSLASLHIEIDKEDRNSWEKLIAQFDDASLYQSWAYGAPDKAKGRVSHIVIKEGEESLGCCQITIKKLPLYKAGIANIKWGPLCLKNGKAYNPEILTQLLLGIKEEYAIKRGYLLRISPLATEERKELLMDFFTRENFERNLSERPYRTFKLDLTPPLDDLRKNFLQKWRNCLNKAERNELTLVEGTSDGLFEIFLKLAQEMCERKDLSKMNNYIDYRKVQEKLPEPLKMRIMICKAGDEPIAATICSVMGNTGIYLLGATGQKSLKLNASYLLQWRMIQYMKENGVLYYDLGAFNPQLNPGVYHFKKGIAGKQKREEKFLGEFYGCFNLSGHIAKFLLDFAKSMRRRSEN